MRKRTIVQSPQVLGDLVRDLRLQGIEPIVKQKGSDSKRGTRPYFVIEWEARG